MPNSECNAKYGASIGRGSFKFTPGKWTTISQRVRLNDVGYHNGQVEVFADGESVISLKGIKLRKYDEGRIRGIFMQTFFGGTLLVSFFRCCQMLTLSVYRKRYYMVDA
jgi:hypothetical protein